jgi:predicted RNase H-like nuclease (RuvC/YqgF family)
MDNRKHMSELHAENSEWLEKLNFYKDQIETLTNRLGEVAPKYTNIEVTAQIEHLQNQLIRQREVLDELRHEIKVDDKSLAANAQQNPVASDHRLFNDHPELRDKMQTYEKLFAELKQEFDAFLSKTL